MAPQEKSVEQLKAELAQAQGALAAAQVEKERVLVENTEFRRTSIKDMIKLPTSGDLMRVRHDGQGPTERPDTVRSNSQAVHSTPATQAALEYAAAQSLGLTK